MSHLKDRYLSTYTGKKFFPYDPRPEQICIEDIAHGLSMLCRFVGQCRFFSSVAEHSIAVARLLPANLKLFGLLHDASEAYLADLPRPVKAGLPEYKAIEANVERVSGKPGLQPHRVESNRDDLGKGECGPSLC